MKAIKCEMCGSTDFVKEGGMYICQHCRTKYTVEEAKKLMVEGTVKIDKSDELKNLYELARRARNDGNGENAMMYYQQILGMAPSDWEANFYTTYYRAYNCKIAEIASAAQLVDNCEDTVLSLVKENVTDEEELAAVIEQLSDDINDIALMLSNAATSEYEGTDYEIRHDFLDGYIQEMFACFGILYDYGDKLIQYFGDKFCLDACVSWENAIDIHVIPLKYLANAMPNITQIAEYLDKIQRYEPDNYKTTFYVAVLNAIYLPERSRPEFPAKMTEATDKFFAALAAINTESLQDYAVKDFQEKFLKLESVVSSMIGYYRSYLNKEATDRIAMRDGAVKGYNLFYYYGKKLLSSYGNRYKAYALDVLKKGVLLHKNFLDTVHTEKALWAKEKAPFDEINVYIKQQDPSYVIVTANSSGCYVATCVYGNYDCPEVWTLRRFRDDTLGATWYGRAFIRTYYAVSPTLVRLFGDTKWFKRIWKGTLDRMVNRLSAKGVANTPYVDREWRK